MLTLATVLFGCAFTLAAAYALGRLVLRLLSVPHTVVFATGAAALSFLVFFVLLAGAAGRGTFLALGCLLLLASCLVPRRSCDTPQLTHYERAAKWLLPPILGAYGVLYAVHALAPELQPDAITYHLGLVAEYLRLGGFPDRVAFYEMLPQGVEMLFLFGFVFGQHSAAKLIHFAFLAATFPLMLAVGRRLGLSSTASAAAAALYVITPVVGVSGTCAYNDAALVFFILAVFYLLCAWRQEEDDRYLFPAGLLAGFCYAVKMTGLLVPGLAVLYVLSRRRWKPALILSAGAALMIAPWIIRNLAVTGNPLAPLFNEVFPNPYFHISSENRLLVSLKTYQGLTPGSAPLELTIRGELLRGLLGPLFLLTPLGLLALRRRVGWLIGVIAVLMAVPWYLNAGTRFLMPSLPWIAFLIAVALPKPLTLACVVFHAVTCWPQVIEHYEAPGAWRLRGFPWQAALRLESERDYLRRDSWAFRVAELVEKHTHPGARVLDFVGAPAAYVTRELVSEWQSALGDRLGEALALAAYQERGLLYQVEVNWPELPVRALRVRRVEGPPVPWSIQEIFLYRTWETIRNSPRWQLEAWPNVWEAPLAFDRSIVSRWATWEPAQPGMYLRVDFDRPLRLTGATLVVTRPADEARLEIHGLDAGGRWLLLATNPTATPHPLVNLRPLAVRVVRRDGVRYILAKVGYEGHGITGRALASHPGDWGVELVANLDDVNLFRIP